MSVVMNLIDGRLVPAASGALSDLIDPSTGQVHARAALSAATDVDAALDAAQRAFEGPWRKTTPGERQRMLLRLADLLERDADRLRALELADTGKTPDAAAGEIASAIDELRFFAGAARMLEGRASAEYVSNHVSMIRREPIGVVAQITPWNYPFMMAVWKIAPALAAGNTVVLKPAETTPSSTLALAVLAAEVLPAGVLNVVTGDRETGRALVESPVPQLVSLTGSTRAGTEVARSASSTLKRLHLELGGNAPVLVFADADIDAVADHLVAMSFYNAGQDCTAATRVIVAGEVRESLVAGLRERVRGLRVGGPGSGADVGPLNSHAQLDRVARIIERLPAHAHVEIGGHRVGETGYFYAPTVVTGLHQDDEAVQTEIFGPVITVQGFSHENEALSFANGVDFGLASSIWTRDHDTALRVSSRLEFGVVWINTHSVMTAEMPHGGYKQSGYGKDLSVYSFEEYTRIKHVMSRVSA